MADTYNIGSSTGPINLQADINTIGLAASRASILDLSNANPGMAVAHSADATGSIPNQTIGNGDSLKGMRLTVFTKITLTGSDAATRATQVGQIDSSYTLDGGDDGEKTYSDPTITYIDPNVFLTFLVDLT